MSRLKLTDMKYGQFRISDIFEIENCKCSKVSELEKGNIPYVGATNRNNGVLSFVDAKIDLITKGNCIAFICDGEGSVGYSIYKGEDFVGSTTIKVGRNPKLNKYNGLFITTVADTVRGKYNFGYKRNETHLKAETLQLPIDLNGNPNWQFMEDYIKQEQKIQAQKIVNYYKQRMIEYCFELLDFENVEWKEFKFEKIFKKIQRGKRLTKSNQIEGNTPYISSTAMNNGVDNFINNEDNVRKFKNCLTVANSGSVGACFYHHYEFVASDHVTSLKLKDENNADKYIYLFISSIIKRLEEKYSFNREINDKRIRQEKIILPVDKNGNPHWQYMRMVMKKIESEKISKVVEHLINTYIN